MSEATPQCALMKRLVAQCKADVESKKRTIANLKSLLKQLKYQTPPDTTAIKALKATLDGLEQELASDLSQCQVLEEEYMADCSQ
jgi:hypothetical protein